MSVVDAYRPGAPPEVRYQWVRGQAEQVAPVAAVLDATDVGRRAKTSSASSGGRTARRFWTSSDG